MTNTFSIPVTVFSILACVWPAAGADAASPIVETAGRSVTRFWDKFSSVTCTETIDQKKLEPGGRQILQKKATYDYLILLQRNGEDLLVEESRVLQGKPGKENDKPLLATSGFSALLLIMHPMFQASFEFTPGPDEMIGGRLNHRLHFRHKKGERSPSVLQLHGRDYPIEWEGEAWIDDATQSVARIQANLKEPMTDIGLLRLSSDVRYTAFREGTSVWLPATASIEAATRKQRWHNAHHFTHYREFNVDTDVKVAAPKQ